MSKPNNRAPYNPSYNQVIKALHIYEETHHVKSVQIYQDRVEIQETTSTRRVSWYDIVMDT